MEHYDYQKDINHALCIKKLSHKETEILEHLIYSSVSASLQKIANQTDTKIDTLLTILNKFQSIGLLKINGDTVSIDKEMRKSFEWQLEKYEDDYEPDFNTLQKNLKQVPIHVLPLWYSISRYANNIFESLIEKYLLTPQSFFRFLAELKIHHPQLVETAEKLFQSDFFEISLDNLACEYKFNENDLMKFVLLLEFNFIASLKYKKVNDGWQGFITPYKEWKEYLSFKRASCLTSIPHEFAIKTTVDQNIIFVNSMSHLMIEIDNHKPSFANKELELPLKKVMNDSLNEKFSQMTAIALSLNLILIKEERLQLTPSGKEWLLSTTESKNIYLYKYCFYKPFFISHIHESLYSEKVAKDVEKSLHLLVKQDWVLFDDFVRASTISFDEDPCLMLQKTGKGWRYKIPSYKEEEISSLKKIFMHWLVKFGWIEIGYFDEKNYLRLTSLGKTYFGG